MQKEAGDDARRELAAALEALEQVLKDEFEALRCLDHQALDRATSRKAELEARLRALPMRAEARPVLERVRNAARMNLALLLHARSCVRGALSLATGTPPPPAVGPSGVPPPGSVSALRLNVRG